nr:hypothetical protein [Tanacetum cinerariifolium]
PSPTIECTLDDVQNKNPSVIETGASDSTILSKPAIKFVKAVDRPTEKATTNKVKTAKKSSVKYAELYRKPSKKSTACYNCGGVDHLSYNCGKWVDHERSWAKNNNTHKSMPPRLAIHKLNISPMRPTRPNTNAAPRSNVNNARPKTTQDLMIILIQRVKRLERELRTRNPPTKIHKDDRGTKLKDSVRTKRCRGSKSKEVVDYKIRLLTKKLEDSEAEH